ncbi:MAG: cation diffusion facilitator family transporter [Calditerrivibrio sp.]|nr:cation diffusion facilitator family transporter [Calditerrivibrio sp.]
MIQKTKLPLISISFAATLAVVKLIVALYSGSLAVLASALDSVLDIVSSAVNYFALRASEAPPDKTHPYGHGKFEALAAFVQSLIILATGVYLLLKSIFNIVSKQPVKDLQAGIFVMLFSVVMTLLLTLILRYYAKKFNSSIILTDSLHYEIDLFTNSSVLISLLLTKYTSRYEIDYIMSALISLYILYTAGKLAKDVSKELLDSEVSDADQKKIGDILSVYNENLIDYHRIRTRSSGKTKFLDMHITLCKNMTLSEAHSIADFIEKDLKDKMGDIDVVIHIDPCEVINCPGQGNCEKITKMDKKKV